MHFAAAWVDAVQRRAALAAVLALLLIGVSVAYSITHFSIDTDPDEMLSKELPYRQKGAALARAFPRYANSIVAVLDGPNADLVDQAARELTASLADDTTHFASIFDPAGMPFFRKNGLLYLDTDELSDLVDRLAEAQPLLGTLWSDPNLPGLLDVLRRAVEESRKGNEPLEVDFVYEQVAAVVEAQAEGRVAALSWQELMRGRELDPVERRRLIVLQAVPDYGSIRPAGASLDRLREMESTLALSERYDVRMRVTGATALETEELSSIQDGMGLATSLSTVLVIGLLAAALRSSRLVVATVVTLFAGLVWSLGLAFATVGRLNLVSVAFVVLFVGLSVDFGIHFALRFREDLDAGADVPTALRGAAGGVGGSLALCAVAAAISFFSFLPTDYVGLAELGWIAGCSMLVALFANLTLLPALLRLLPPTPAAPRSRRSSRPEGDRFVRRRAKPIALLAAAAAVIAVGLGTRARFDFDPLNLRDPTSESVRTLFELAEDQRTTPYRVVELAPSLDAAAAAATRAAALDRVENAVTLRDFVPQEQEMKLEVLGTAGLFLLPALAGETTTTSVSDEERTRAVREFRAELGRSVADAAATTAAERRLAAAFSTLETRRGLDAATLAELEERLVGTLPARLADLQLSLDAEPVTLADLPASIRERWVTADGRARLEVTPKAILAHDDAALQAFVREVKTVLPDAAGMPIDIVESGRAVVWSFAEATAISVALITGLVVVLLQRLRDVLLIFAPLALAGLLTVASSVLLDQPFNFANVIVLPLLFGLGVASGIHLVMRERDAGDADVLETSTPRAVVFSALTTIGSFGSLALVRHPGTASMGLLLTIALAMTLLCTLIVLPALMVIFPIRDRASG